MERIEQFNTTLHRLIIPLSELCPVTPCPTGTCGRGAIHTGSLCNEQKWHLSLPSPCRLHRKASHVSNKHKVFL